jgi:monofunctional biosynthetic peptidoglycan transglycosylase
MAPPLLAANRSGKDQRGKARRIGRFVAYTLVAALALPVLLILVYRFVPPPLTPLMVIRWAQGAPIRQRSVPLDRISPALIRAVVASEDEKFCFHHGFDWDAEAAAWKDWRAGREPKGASTITMQTAKNLFLWPGRSVVRKAIEAYLTVWLELLWSKPHIIETYLNIIEWGDGIYGAEAAAEAHFHKPAAALSAREAALFAAVLPNPRRWSPEAPTAYIDARAATIRARMPEVAVPSAAGCR